MTRRSALLLPLSVVGVASSSAEVMDTHVHFYDPSRAGGVPWPKPSEKVLYRRVMPEDYQKLSTAKVIIIEASPLVEDNQWILDLAAKHPAMIRGCVGNLDPASTDFAANLERFRANPLFRGIRLGVQKAADGIDKLGLLQDSKLSLDLIGDARMYALAARIAERYPRLRIILDHLPLVETDASIAQLRNRRNVYAKVSWILRSGTDTLEAHKERLDEVRRVFGEDRVLYGTNWPVSDLVVPYEKVHQTAVRAFQDRELAKYLAINSKAAYGWK